MSRWRTWEGWLSVDGTLSCSYNLDLWLQRVPQRSKPHKTHMGICSCEFMLICSSLEGFNTGMSTRCSPA